MALLADGLLLMVVGMGTVFSFLIVMSFWISLSSSLLPRSSEQPQQRQVSTAMPVSPAPAEQQLDQSVLMAVISAAVQRYRAERGQ